jgi:hypothetical protein
MERIFDQKRKTIQYNTVIKSWDGFHVKTIGPLAVWLVVGLVRFKEKEKVLQ